MRNLIYIPIIHTQADMGALAESFQAIAIQKIGREKWKNNVTATEQFWSGIRREILKWDLPFPHVRLYQDGLPMCGCEADIVADLAKSGSPNHQLLVHLMERGAVLMGTESPDLLIEEYNLVQRVLAARDPKEAARIREQQKTLSQRLLLSRDQFVSGRINETLGIGETGVLFLGMFHSPMQWFAADIQVSYPIGRPGFPEGSA
jgi:hypothetical protein